MRLRLFADGEPPAARPALVFPISAQNVGAIGTSNRDARGG
jgi:hypothetical protein